MENFNPRAYVRHDRDKDGQIIEQQKFQSTCLREARPGSPSRPRRPGDFNPRAYVRHDSVCSRIEEIEEISIHVPT